MNSRRRFRSIFATLLLMLIPAASLLAQDQASADNPGNDPPARVARIQYISGEVSMQPGGVNDWAAASLNRPLTTSDRVWTDKNSRVELNVGGGYLRMNSESSLTLTNVADNTTQAELDQGVLELTVRHLEPGEIYEIDTPNLAFTVMKPGVYRFDVYPNEDQTWVTVRKGYGEATGRGSAVKVSDGQQVRFTGQNSLQHTAEAAPAPDGFDDWAKVRDKRLDSSESARYVAPGVIGYEDLDTYGTWRVVPTYGAIWVPSAVPAGWAPYRYGNWSYIAPWGWTWVDSAPWGFAPFHYGRWVSYGGYWGWAPGPIIGVGWRPYYAPALVGWVGGAGWGFGVSFGFGAGCGWFPLGWGEPFYPWYHGYRGGFVSRNYIRNVNVTNTRINNITNVTNNYYNNNINNTHFANRNIAGAVTAAPKSALASGQNIAKFGTVVPRSELGKGQVVRNVDVSPTREAMLGGHTPRTTGIPPRAASDRSVVTHATPPVRQANPTTEAHNVPQTPATLGARNPNSPSDAVGTHNVPRPPEHNASANVPAASGYGSQPGSQRMVPKPPYAGGAAPGNTNAAAVRSSSPNGGEHVSSAPHETGSVQRPAAATGHSQQPASRQENKPHDAAKPNPGMASVRPPQPPAGYAYHAAPSYSGSTNSTSSPSRGGTARSYSNPAVASGPSRGNTGYTAPSPSYRAAGTYSAPPAYSAAPTYNARASAPAAPRYTAPTAPHYSGGGGGGNYSGGTSSSRSQATSGHNGGHSR